MPHKRKILILGSSGMLGHALFLVLNQNPNFETLGTVRNLEHTMNSTLGRLFLKDGSDQNAVCKIIEDHQPNVIINAIGLIKQKASSINDARMREVNSLLPQKLSAIANKIGAFVIHFSTDCVFSGLKGDYTEADVADAEDVYGRSKFLGELHDPHTLTLRTSIIGHELKSSKSLMDWFLSQENIVSGYKNALFSGLTTIEVAKVVSSIIEKNMPISGLYHLSCNKISKYDLLKLINEVYEKGILIEPDYKLVIDRSLDSEKFKSAMNYTPPKWRAMLSELRKFYSNDASFR
ncbi:SDR family oxidoreductase [Paracoccaceae bacterium]|nr:SDR family oxidoreductase [Paracoccaceae bacterium]